MKKTKLYYDACLIALCAVALTGCGPSGTEESREPDSGPVTEQNRSAQPQEKLSSGNSEEADSSDADGFEIGKTDSASLYEQMLLTGNVTEIADTGCTVNRTLTEDDGKTAVSAAPGYESEENNVIIEYQETCVFQKASVYISSGTADILEASSDDVRMQASVLVYGSYTDTNHVSAEKIIIVYYI